jgi:hypothetical protein
LSTRNGRCIEILYHSFTRNATIGYHCNGTRTDNNSCHCYCQCDCNNRCKEIELILFLKILIRVPP